MSSPTRAGLLLPQTVGGLAEITGARLVGAADRSVDSISIDTRGLSPGALFVALPGTNTDGHAYVTAAFEAGAVAALVAESRYEDTRIPPGLSLLVVDDPLAALATLATAALDAAPELVRIGITGSNGKTTTKELVAAVLATEKRVYKTKGNYNSVIGIPLSVFAIPSDAEVAVFELAMNQIGEMATLSSIVRPDIAVITNIGTAHIGMIGTQDGIAREKKAISSSFTGSQTLFVPAAEPYREFLAKDVRGRVLVYGDAEAGNARPADAAGQTAGQAAGARADGADNTDGPGAETHGVAAFADKGLVGIDVVYRGSEFVVPLIGLQNRRAIEAALAVAELFCIDTNNVARGLTGVSLPEGRGKVIPGAVTIIEDCYNASPESTAAALAFLAGLEWAGRKVAVLGDMLELGDKSLALHRGLADAPAASTNRVFGGGPRSISAVFTLGTEMAGLREALAEKESPPAGTACTDINELDRALAAYLREGDLVLLKASRGMALERLIYSIQNGIGVPGGAR